MLTVVSLTSMRCKNSEDDVQPLIWCKQMCNATFVWIHGNRYNPSIVW